MNSCCLQYYIIPDQAIAVKQLEIEKSECDGCNCECGYIQYESLAPYMPKLTNNYTKDEDHILLELKLRQQIIEISRLFDITTKVADGYYSKAHYKVIKLYGNSGNYLSIPDFVEGSLELYTEDGYLINPKSYHYKDGYLIINECGSHSRSCGCHSSCGSYQKRRIPIGWNGCFQAKAKFGKVCADKAVEMAIRTYLIEFNTFGDQKEASYQGYPVTRSFRVPDVWSTLVNKYLQEKRLNYYFGFA